MNFGVVHRTMAGESVCGDSYLILEGDHSVLLALVDGLGHGPKAAEASQAAVGVIREGNTDPSLRDLMKNCHERLRRTRGAVIGIIRIEPEEKQLRYVGIGNIGMRVLGKTHQIRPVSRQGLVGSNLGHSFEEVVPYHPGDLVIMHSDGLSERFATDDILGLFQKKVQTIADELVDRFGKDTDDVTVIVAK